MKKEIIFWAPIGRNTPPERIGGAEAGCLKTMAIYADAGIKVLHINRPVSKGGIMQYVLGMFLSPIKLFFMLLLHRKAVVHIVGFYRRTIGIEKLLVSIAHNMGHKVIYEPRNGAMVQTYNDGDEKYRCRMKYLLTIPDVVLCQGLEYVDMIKSTFGINRSYYPNYIMDEFIIPNNLDRGETIKLIYFGRVVPEKNVDVVIKTAADLKQKGYRVDLNIVGGCSDQYKLMLDDIIEKDQVSDIVNFHGRRPFQYISDLLHHSHYYIFPSTESNEGHSNALTEAMGCGVVPIVSRAGFNVSICGCTDLVANDIQVKSYSSIIQKIEDSKQWKSYSNLCYARVVNNYTQSIVSKKLVEYVMPLFDRK